MAFVPSSTLLRDLLKAFGLEGRKGVRGLVLEVRLNEAARLHIEEFIDTDQSPLDDLVGCLHRLTVERVEVDGRGCVTPVLHKPMKWEQSIPVGVDGMDMDAQREAFKGHLEGVCSIPAPKELEALRADIRESQSATESRRRAELESVRAKFKAFVEREFPSVPAEIIAKSEAGQSYASSIVMLPAGADLDTAKAILDTADPDEPTVIEGRDR